MRNSLFVYLGAAIIAAAVAFGVTCIRSPSLNSATKAESVYDRVLRTGTIRCGYIIYPPYLVKDPNTGAMSGPSFDVVSAVAKEMGLKLDWTEETGWGTFQEGLNGNRYDLMCVPVWQTGGRARVALLTEPVYYNAEYAVARDDDNRFDHGLEAINKPDVRIIVGDNDPTQATRRLLFPLAQELSYPPMAESAQGAMSVTTGKADIFFENISNVNKFNAGSPQKIKIVADGKALRVFANVFAVKQGENDFKAALDSTIEALRNYGEITTIVAKYAPDILDGQPSYLDNKNAAAK